MNSCNIHEYLFASNQASHIQCTVGLPAMRRNSIGLIEFPTSSKQWTIWLALNPLKFRIIKLAQYFAWVGSSVCVPRALNPVIVQCDQLVVPMQTHTGNGLITNGSWPFLPLRKQCHSHVLRSTGTTGFRMYQCTGTMSARSSMDPSRLWFCLFYAHAALLYLRGIRLVLPQQGRSTKVCQSESECCCCLRCWRRVMCPVLPGRWILFQSFVPHQWQYSLAARMAHILPRIMLFSLRHWSILVLVVVYTLDLLGYIPANANLGYWKPTALYSSILRKRGSRTFLLQGVIIHSRMFYDWLTGVIQSFGGSAERETGPATQFPTPGYAQYTYTGRYIIGTA